MKTHNLLNILLSQTCRLANAYMTLFLIGLAVKYLNIHVHEHVIYIQLLYIANTLSRNIVSETSARQYYKMGFWQTVKNSRMSFINLILYDNIVRFFLSLDKVYKQKCLIPILIQYNRFITTKRDWLCFIWHLVKLYCIRNMYLSGLSALTWKVSQQCFGYMRGMYNVIFTCLYVACMLLHNIWWFQNCEAISVCVGGGFRSPCIRCSVMHTGTL